MKFIGGIYPFIQLYLFDSLIIIIIMIIMHVCYIIIFIIIIISIQLKVVTIVVYISQNGPLKLQIHPS